jgi:hypothetical protein
MWKQPYLEGSDCELTAVEMMTVARRARKQWGSGGGKNDTEAPLSGSVE